MSGNIKQELTNGDIVIIRPRFWLSLGLEGSMILNQIAYWITVNEDARRKDTHYHDGLWWMYLSYSKWIDKHFPAWEERTMRRYINYLTELGILVVGNHNKWGADKTNWYAIDYPMLDEFMAMWEQHGSPVRKQRNDAYTAFMSQWKLRCLLPKESPDETVRVENETVRIPGQTVRPTSGQTVRPNNQSLTEVNSYTDAPSRITGSEKLEEVNIYDEFPHSVLFSEGHQEVSDSEKHWIFDELDKLYQKPISKTMKSKVRREVREKEDDNTITQSPSLIETDVKYPEAFKAYFHEAATAWATMKINMGHKPWTERNMQNFIGFLQKYHIQDRRGIDGFYVWLPRWNKSAAVEKSDDIRSRDQSIPENTEPSGRGTARGKW